MLQVGLTGGIACGKSLVCREFARLGAATIDADDLARQAVLPGQPAHDAIRDAFGREVLLPDGAVDRRKLAEIVFSDPARRQRLNQIVHPEVRRLQKEWLDRLRRAGQTSLAIVDAALMIETGSYRECDAVVVVTCSEEQQIERLMSRDGLTDAQARTRVASQMPISEKERLADFVIDNSGARQATLRRVREVFQELSALAARKASPNP